MTALEKWARGEQVALWHDFDREIRHSYNGIWSVGASAIAGRIVSCARIIGPSYPGDVPWVLVAGDIYRTLLKDVGGISAGLSGDILRRSEKLMTEKGDGPTIEAARLQYQLTCDALRRPREMDEIRAYSL